MPVVAILGEDHPDTLAGRENDLASTLGDLRRYQEAVDLLKDTRARSLNVLGAPAPRRLVTRNLAAALIAAGQKCQRPPAADGRQAEKEKRRFGRKRQ
ncbi:ATP/GTP binding protein OS=Streptomyces glaucescens OX=1907 GN=SGLAU_19920 PE=4 SV=1 [Streptomyces glaucescens]